MAIDRTGIFLSLKVAPEGEKGTRVDISDIIVRSLSDPRKETAHLLGVTFTDSDHKADRLQISVDNWDLSLFDNQLFRKGAILEYTWGYAAVLHPTIQAVIQSVKGAQVLTIEALAKSVLMHKQKRARVFSGVKKSDVALQIAADDE